MTLWALPRSRGENSRYSFVPLGLFGSSPLTRGKRDFLDCRVGPVRLIPAHAGKTSARSARLSPRAAHPRSRGENGLAETRAAIGGGSSPLTRGKRETAEDWFEKSRLIPAHAGKTHSSVSFLRAGPAHPRSRGENFLFLGTLWWNCGSSPLTRGKLRRDEVQLVREGLIPAHAGKTDRPRRQGERPAAHPRSRGENCVVLRAARFSPGSSPLTRGKLTFPIMTKGGGGLIPAHAGKTVALASSQFAKKAHPRSRGENRPPKMRIPFSPGSSPLTRGKLAIAMVFGSLMRLIPAHAGKTVRARTAQVLRAAHPRSRGENDGGFAWKAGFPGSSPLTRGKRRARRPKVRVSRLIPAHAGKTARVPASQRRRQAHPRSRGENGRGSASPTREGGSSPLTRGKQARVFAGDLVRRLIPAHAGKTGGERRPGDRR